MNRLGIFGGSFDPPHIGHLRVALQAADELDLDRLLWIPAAHSPFKSSVDTTLPTFRVEMVRLMTRKDRRFRLDSREIRRKGPSFTVDTLESLSTEFPDATRFLILGEDSLVTLNRWKRPERIRELSKIVVYKRVMTDIADQAGPIPKPDHVLGGLPVDVTSTDIRERVRLHKPLDHLLTPEVAAYIYSRRLYLAG